MSRKVLWINPVGSDFFDAPVAEYIGTVKRPETEVEVVSLSQGPLHLEYHYYEAMILPETLGLLKKAEVDGYDGAVIGCFYDPGLREARELLDRMPVTAPAEAAMHIATTLGNTFSIIVGRKKWIPKMHENVVRYGFKDHLASFKSVDMGVHDFQTDPKETERRLKQAALEAIQKDGAEVILLGCTLEFGFFSELQKEIQVPVIDAVVAPVKYLELLMEIHQAQGWTQSKAYGYESPPQEELREWSLDKAWK